MNKKLIIYLILIVVLVVAAFLVFQKQLLTFKENKVSFNNQSTISQDQSSESEKTEKREEQNIKEQNIDTKKEEKVEEDIQEEEAFTMDEIAKHNSEESCWTIIRGEVYDLTDWISQHPGGPDKILSICGKDGTEAFIQKHGGKEKPEETLKKFKIGIFEAQ